MRIDNTYNLVFYFLIFIFSYSILKFEGLFFSMLFITAGIIPIARDDYVNYLGQNKHGINKNNASRLGGIILCTILFYLVITKLDFFSSKYILILLLFFSFISIGFLDDLRLIDINSKLKLLLQIIIIFIIFFIIDFIVINFAKEKYLSFVNDIPFLAKFISFFIVLSFINASNITDGVNGLLSGSVIILFSIFYYSTNLEFFLIIIYGYSIFFFVNFFIGKIFLGDTGSYLSGILIIFSSIYVYNNYDFSLSFLLSLFSYQICELINSFSRRILNNKDPFKSDNNHLHNFLYIYLSKFNKSNLFTNSLNGLILLILFPLFDFLIYLIVDKTYSQIYWFTFLFHVFFYYVLRKVLTKDVITSNAI